MKRSAIVSIVFLAASLVVAALGVLSSRPTPIPLEDDAMVIVIPGTKSFYEPHRNWDDPNDAPRFGSLWLGLRYDRISFAGIEVWRADATAVEVVIYDDDGSAGYMTESRYTSRIPWRFYIPSGMPILVWVALVLLVGLGLRRPR